jgi:GNAT superfamily N-acetyltransferase
MLRAAKPDDVEAIATVWHTGWRDGHLGHVPEALVAHRELDEFRRRVPDRLATTTVAVDEGAVVGFVTLHDDEVEQVYVASVARGTGTAAALLAEAERQVARRFDRAWLAVVAGNARARRFYAREGWSDAGPIDYPAEIPGGTLVVPSQRYEKNLTTE